MTLYLSLFFSFLKIGAFTFGGGYAMIPMIMDEVIANGWLSQEQLIDFIAISESTPGPFAVNIATFVGSTTGGIGGALLSTLGVIVTSFVVILLIAKYFGDFKDNFYVKSALSALRPAVIGFIAAATFSIAITCFVPGFEISGLNVTLPSQINGISIFIFVVMFFFNKWEKLHPIKLILFSGLMGIFCYGGLDLIMPLFG